MKLFPACFAVVLASSLAAPAFADPLTVGADATIEKVLAGQIGKSVTVRTGCDPEITGKLKSVSSSVVHLTELSGKEFFDAVVETDSITSVVVRTR